MGAAEWEKPGQIIGDRFELLRLTGKGGLGLVFQAREISSGKLCALQLLQGAGARDRRRIEREVEALSELRHPGIVQYVAHGEMPSGEPYLVMEWLEGEDLASRIARGRLTVEESITLGLRVAEALGAVHARGIVHRDIKPSNLFLVGGSVDRVKILDWPVDTTDLTESGVVLGTLGYMAPEQAGNSQKIDARTDVFALGCVLFECLTGQPAFAGDRIMAVLAKVLFEDVPRLRELRPDVPASLDALVSRMLAKDPAQRPRHGLEVAAALAALDLQGDWRSTPKPLVRPQGHAMGLTVQDLEDSGALQELTAVFSTHEHALYLLGDIPGLSVGRLPEFNATNASAYWRQVTERLGQGIVENGLEALMAAAAREFPGNDKFRPYARKGELSAPPRSMSKQPEQPSRALLIEIHADELDEEVLALWTMAKKLAEKREGKAKFHLLSRDPAMRSTVDNMRRRLGVDNLVPEIAPPSVEDVEPVEADAELHLDAWFDDSDTLTEGTPARFSVRIRTSANKEFAFACDHLDVLVLAAGADIKPLRRRLRLPPVGFVPSEPVEFLLTPRRKGPIEVHIVLLVRNEPVHRAAITITISAALPAAEPKATREVL